MLDSLLYKGTYGCLPRCALLVATAPWGFWWHHEDEGQTRNYPLHDASEHRMCLVPSVFQRRKLAPKFIKTFIYSHIEIL